MTTIKLRRGTAAAWTSANPVLALGEAGVETDTRKIKFGDGSTAWNSLLYSAGGGGSGAPTDATYITQTANGTLSAEQALASLATGVLKVTTTTGVLSTATEGTDYYKPGGTDVAVADGGTGASTASAARTNLGLVIATDVEAHDPDLTTIAGLTPTNDDVLQRKAGAWANRTIAQLLADLAAAGTTFQPLDSDLTAIAALTTTSFGRSLLALADAAAGRTALGLGTAALSASTDFQPIDSDLTSIAALTTTSFGRAFLALADAAAARTAIGTVIGTDVQAYDAELAALAGLTSAADKLPYFTGSGTAAVADFTSTARSLVDDSSVSAMRTTLGIPAAVGGVEWTVVTKASDESVSSSTVVQDDDELFFTATSGKVYEIELFIVYVSPLGGTTPDIKIAFGEDNTLRGSAVTVGLNTADSSVVSAGNTALSNQPTYGTAATNRAIHVRCFHTGNGASFKLQWAQSTSGGNATTVKAGSLLRYRLII